MTVGDVPIGEVGGRDECLIRDGDAMVRLVAVAQALQDLDGVSDRGLVDLHGLEAAFERGVLLEMLAVLVECGRADGLQFTAGEHRLEDRRRVDGSFGRARPDEGMDLVDEQDDVAACADLLQHLLEALLEVTAVTGTGDERTEVERVELLGLERVGHVVGDDLLSEALHDRGLADARFADEDWVVLRAAREHLHDTLELADATDDRVELLLASELREVAAELVEHEAALAAALGLTGRGARGTGGCTGGFLAALGALIAREQLDDLLAHAATDRRPV